LENILLDSSLTAKLFNYGMFHVTNGGSYVSFPIGQPKYAAPEVFLSEAKRGTHLFSCDVWSLGIILAEVCLGRPVYEELKIAQIIQKVIDFSTCDKAVLSLVLEEHGALDILQVRPPLDNSFSRITVVNPCPLCRI